MTTTGKPALVYEALMARVASIDTGSPGLPISYPEPSETFTPPADGKYLLVEDLTNAPAWEGLDGGRIDQGLLQVTVIWPKNDGMIRPKQIAGAIIEHFPVGLSLPNGAARVKITRPPYAASPIIDPDKVRIPVTVSWTA